MCFTNIHTKQKRIYTKHVRGVKIKQQQSFTGIINHGLRLVINSAL